MVPAMNGLVDPGGARCATHPDVPAVQACERCGTFVCLGCLVKLPNQPGLCRSCSALAGSEPLAWDRREELGLLKAYWKTCLAVMGTPTATAERARTGGSLGSSLAFTALSGLVGYTTTIIFYGAFFLLMTKLPSQDGAELAKAFGKAGPLLVLAGMLGYLVFIIAALLGGQILMGSLEHALLKSLGGAGTWTATMRAYSLSLGPNLLGVVPVCSLYVMPFWSIVARVFTYRAAHQVTTGRAVAGALVPSLVLGCLCVGAYAAMIAVYASTHGR